MQSKNQPISPKVKLTFIIICVIFILNALWMSIVYRQQLFVQSLNFIYDYQNNGNKFTEVVYNLFSLASGTECTVALIVLVLLLPFRKANALVLAGYVTVNVYIMAVFKIAMADTRPAWYTDGIQQLQWKCEYTYGFPSGHVWIVLILHQAIFSDIVGTGPYRIYLLLPLVFVIVVPLSRLYLGAHTTDQVINSLVYSIASTILYKYHIQKLFFVFVSGILEKGKKIIYLIVTIFLQILVFFPCVLLYNINVDNNRIGEVKLDRINKICDLDYSLEELQGRQAAQAAIGNVVIGGIYALLLYTETQLVSGDRTLNIRKYFIGKWNFGEQKVRNFLLKMTMYIVTGAFFFGIFFILIPHFIDNFYGDYFSMMIAWLAVPILWLRYVPEYAFKWGLIFLQEEKTNQSSNRLSWGKNEKGRIHKANLQPASGNTLCK